MNHDTYEPDSYPMFDTVTHKIERASSRRVATWDEFRRDPRLIQHMRNHVEHALKRFIFENDVVVVAGREPRVTIEVRIDAEVIDKSLDGVAIPDDITSVSIPVVRPGRRT